MAQALKEKNGDGNGVVAASHQHKHDRRKSRTGENSLKHWDNMKNAVLGILQEHNQKDIPSGKKFFKEINHLDVFSAACVYYGGVFGVRAKLMEEGLLPLKD